MSAGTFHQEAYDANSLHPLKDPGNAGIIDVQGKSGARIDLVSAGAETRTLPAPAAANVELFLGMMTDGGDITLTITGGFDEDGATTFVFSDPGQFLLLRSMRSSTTAYVWRRMSDYASANLTLAEAGYLNGITPGTQAASKAVIADANVNTGVSKITALHIGTSGSETQVTATGAELNYLDQNLSTNILARGAGVDTAESYVGAISRMGGLIVTTILVDISTLIGSATDLDIIGESAAASCHFGQITTAKSGTLIAGRVTCLEVPAGGADDLDFYSSTVGTGTQDVIITDAALGTETALVTNGEAWTAGMVKPMTSLPTANDYIYIINGEASGGTFTAGKFLIELFGA